MKKDAFSLKPKVGGQRSEVRLLASAVCLLTIATAQAANSNAPTAAKTNAPAHPSTSTNAAPTEAPLPQSRFTAQLENGGKDPFYPESTRQQPRDTNPARTNVVAAPPVVKINGFSGNPAQPLVILNNVTFGIGDEQQVITAVGRVRVRCVEIRAGEQTAVIEMNGERRELRFLNKK